MNKDDVLQAFREALPGRPVHWTSSRTSKGDFDGRETSLEIFDVPSDQQRDLLRRLRDLRAEAARVLGASLQLIFHTPEATSRHYSWVRDASEPIPLETLLQSSPEAIARRSSSEAARVIDRGPVTTLHRPLRTAAKPAA